MNEAKMKVWLEALRSGKFSQTRQKLHDRQGYCCLGVADEACFGAKWKPTIKGAYFDDEDNLTGLSAQRAKELGLLRYMTPGEEGKIRSIGIRFERARSRQDVLAGLNDQARYTLQEIADFIQDMGWDKEDA